MGEEDLRRLSVDAIQIVKIEHRVLGKSVFPLIDPGEHHTQPGTPAFAPRDEQPIGPVKLAILPAASQPTIDVLSSLIGQEKKQRENRVPGHTFEHVQTSYELLNS